MTRPTAKQLQRFVDSDRRHAILHADCLDVGGKLPAGCVGLTCTDPPFGCNWQGSHGLKGTRAIANDKRPFVWWLHHAYLATRRGGALLCFTRPREAPLFKAAIEAAGFTWRADLIWHKAMGGVGDCAGAPQPDYELIVFATKGRFKLPGRRPSSVLRHTAIPGTKREHPTQKPAALMAELVGDYSSPDDLVYDPCCGIASTGEGCLLKGRRFLGVELDATHHATGARRLRNAERQRDRTVRPRLARPLHTTPTRAAA
ncbi:MAG: DNA methyltransferase [Planctomycetota bacterium]